MNTELFEDIKLSKNIEIIGLSILGNANLKEMMHQNLYQYIDKGEKKCTIISESDNQLFQYSLLTDISSKNRISFEELKIRRDYFYQNIKINKDLNNNIEYKITSLHIPIFIIKTDENIWFTLTNELDINNYMKIVSSDKLYKSLDNYIYSLSMDGVGKKYLADTEEEMLELFDQKHIPRGIFPRNSFYNTDHYQYVIWGLVFNREGKLLIHKRKENAKDNQGMWDKSIGGHIDFNRERSTQDAAVRELIEELYTEEKSQQTGHAFSMLSEDISKVYFLGDWRIEKHGAEYLNQISLLEKNRKSGEENWVFYKIPTTISHNTPRILPDGKGENWLRVIADSFIFITNTTVNDKTIANMSNSDYKLVEPSQLKTWMDDKIDDNGNPFIITPDLKYIMTGILRDIIDEVSLTIKYSGIRQC